MIVLWEKTDQPLLNILDIKLERNSFGRQQESFEANVSLDSIGISKFNGVFIRAPSVEQVGPEVKVLSKFNEKIVAVQKGNVIGTSFHPELTKDSSLHKYFLNLVQNQKNNQNSPCLSLCWDFQFGNYLCSAGIKWNNSFP